MDTANMNLMKLIDQFKSEDACRSYLEHIRWPDGVQCPRCESKSIQRADYREQFDCNGCSYRFSVTSGTIMHDTHLDLWKWFAVAYMMIEGKKGISALQVKRTFGVAYKTAWYLCHRIRKAMRDAYPMPLKGIVEVDETFLGPKTKNRGPGSRKAKIVILGAIQREGRIILQVGKNTSRAQLHNFINGAVHDDAEAIYTDQWPAYKGIGDENTRHETVNHSEDEWVRGDVHTNSIENVWQLFKRAVVGTYHHLSRKHMDAYLDELEWRFNNRENPFLFRDTIRKLCLAEKMEYRQLIA